MIFALGWPREVLYQRIDRRVDAMLEAGLIEEVSRLHADSERFPTAAQAIGYKELLAALSGQDRAVLELDASLRRGEPVDPEAASRLLFAFCRDALRRAQALLP